MSSKRASADSHNELQMQSLIYVLVLGGIVGCLDPLMETGAGIRASIAFWSGVGLLLLVPILWRTKLVQPVMGMGIVIAWSCFFSCYMLSGDHFYLAQGTSVPIATAMFMRFRFATLFFLAHAICSVSAAGLIQMQVWVPPFDPADLRRGIVGEAASVALVAAALTIPAALKELRSLKAARREAEARKDLETERRRFESVVNASYGAIIEADHRGRIRFAEGPLIKAFGYEPDELMGRPQVSFVPRTDREAWRGIGEETLGYNREFRLKDSNGNSSWVSGSVAVLLDDEGRRYVTAIRDIRQEVLARERLHEMARLEGLATVCAGLAHDFNNLLTVFGLRFELIGDEGLRDELLKAHEQATDLTRGLLSFANRGESIGRPTHVGDFIKEMKPIVSRIAGATVECCWTIDCAHEFVVVDHARLQQLLLNLVTNARHAMADGGRLRLSFARTEVGLSDSRLAPGNYLRLEIVDDGVGMDEPTLARAIEPFFTTKPRGVGTGLGLSTTHGTVSAAGGSLRINSREGAGTTVTVMLPLAQHSQSLDKVPSNSSHDTYQVESCDGCRIALVEDRKLLADSLVQMLQRLGHSATAYYSAEDFLVSDSRANTDLVITDMELPGLSGLALAEQLIDSRPHTKVILMSGHHVEESISCPESVSFLAKPFTLAQLLETIEGSIAAST